MNKVTNKKVSKSSINLIGGVALPQEVGTGTGAAPANNVPAGPPSVGAPDVPVGATPVTAALIRGMRHPLAVQENHGQGVASELSNLESAGSMTGVVGGNVPSPGFLASVLLVALAWSIEHKRTEAWAAYVRGQRALVWDQLFKSFDAFEPALDVVLATNPTLASGVTALQAFIAARSDVSQRAATTRAAPKAAQAKATKSTRLAAEATTEAQAAAAAEAILHPAPAASTTPAAAPASPAPASTTPAGTPGGTHGT